MEDPPPYVPKPLLPHPDSDRLSSGVRRCLPLAVRWSGIIYRATSVRRANSSDLIAGVGAFLTGGRWTPPGVSRAVYGSLDEAVALEEARQQNRRQGVLPWMSLPLVLTAIAVELEPVLDLTDGLVRRTLRVSRDRMRSEPSWIFQDRGQEALTQALGRLARKHGFVALIVPSAARSPAANLVAFPDEVAAPNRMDMVNPDRLPPGQG